MTLKWVVAITGEVDIRSGNLHWGQEEPQSIVHRLLYKAKCHYDYYF